MTNSTSTAPVAFDEEATVRVPAQTNRELVYGCGHTAHETEAVRDGACSCIECDGAGQVPANEDMDEWETCGRCKGSGVEACWYCDDDAVVVAADENKVDRHMCAACAADIESGRSAA